MATPPPNQCASLPARQQCSTVSSVAALEQPFRLFRISLLAEKAVLQIVYRHTKQALSERSGHDGVPQSPRYREDDGRADGGRFVGPALRDERAERRRRPSPSLKRFPGSIRCCAPQRAREKCPKSWPWRRPTMARYRGNFGKRRLGQGPAMTRDTVFRVASMVKLVTSVAALQLVEHGRAVVGHCGARYRPRDRLAASARWLRRQGIAASCVPAQRPIPLRHLLTHTSGFAYRLWNSRPRAMPSRSSCCRRRKENWRRTTPLMFDPGTHSQYGTSVNWVGRIVEATSDETWTSIFASAFSIRSA